MTMRTSGRTTRRFSLDLFAVAGLVVGGLAAAAAGPVQAQSPVQAQGRDERFAQPGSMPGFVVSLRAWLDSKSSKSSKPSNASAPRHVAAPVVTPAPTPAPVAAIRPVDAADAAPASAASPASIPVPRARPAQKVAVAPAPKPETQTQTASLESAALEPAATVAARFAPVLNAPVRTPSHAGGCAGQRVTAAYYWQGTRTASGEPFDPQGLTAAHRTLPFGTKLTVTNPRTGRSVQVTINDRGPFVHGVSIDLSLGAAKAIGMRGTGAVCIL